MSAEPGREKDSTRYAPAACMRGYEHGERMIQSKRGG